jgi:hypothetical protein
MDGIHLSIDRLPPEEKSTEENTDFKLLLIN